MSLAAVDRAMAAALLGIKPGVTLPPQGAGFTSPVFDAQSNTQLRVGTRRLLLSKVPTELPVYRFSTRGQRMIETFPALSFELVGMQFNPQRYIHPRDVHREPVLSSHTEVKDGARTIRGPALSRIRPHALPFDLIYDVRCWFNNQEHQLSVLQTLLETLGARGALFGVLEDGTHKSWDCWLQTINNVDDQEPTLEDSNKRAWAWVLTYNVQTHLDNTAATRIQANITSPVELEMNILSSLADRVHPVVSVSIIPPFMSFRKDSTLEFTAVATYSDGVQLDVTKKAAWRSKDPSLLRFSQPGVFIGDHSDSETLRTTIEAEFRGVTGTAAAHGIIESRRA